MSSAPVKALCFDVFGTVTDWYSSVTAEGEKFSQKTGHELPWGEFVKQWRIDGYLKALREISSGEREIIPTATIHREKLLSLFKDFGITDVAEEDIEFLNSAWNRLDVWDDVVDGLSQLKQHYLIMPFSNGDYRCLLDIAKRNGLPWDGIISADFFKKVKPDPTIYLDAANLLQLRPEEIMMVACHDHDLAAAQGAGLRTAYVNRPLEYGPGVPPEEKTAVYDYDADSFIELAAQLHR